MSEIQTLEELQAENEALETQNVDESASETEEVQSESANELQDDAGEVAEPEGEESSKEDVEAWLLDGEGEEDSSTAAKIRRKWKGRAKQIEEEKNSEIEELKAQIEAMKTPQQVSAPTPAKMPTLADFDYDEEAHEKALNSWIAGQVSAHQNNNQKSYQQQLEETRVKQEIDDAVNPHYTRAQSVAEKAGISAEVYQQADMNVRRAMENVRPGQGDQATDELIKMIGEGSEKVLYFLGRNQNKLNEMTSLLKSNPIEFAMKIGELKSSFAAKQNSVSRAPRPTKKLSTDGATKPVDAYKKKYDKAKDAQEQFDIRRS